MKNPKPSDPLTPASSTHIREHSYRLNPGYLTPPSSTNIRIHSWKPKANWLANPPSSTNTCTLQTLAKNPKPSGWLTLHLQPIKAHTREEPKAKSMANSLIFYQYTHTLMKKPKPTDWLTSPSSTNTCTHAWRTQSQVAAGSHLHLSPIWAHTREEPKANSMANTSISHQYKHTLVKNPKPSGWLILHLLPIYAFTWPLRS